MGGWKQAAGAAVASFLAACAGGAGPSRPASLPSQAPLAAYSAEARVTSFGPEGRLRGTATVLVQRPAQLRYELQGPHGGVLLAVACDGQRLQALDLRANRFIEAAATPENFDRLLGIAPLHLDATAWVALLFGELVLPSDAAFEADATQLRWQRQDTTFVARLAAPGGPLLELTVCREGAVVSAVRVLGRDGRGVPTGLYAQVPAARIEADLRLRDVAYAPDIAADAFRLPLPKGVRVESMRDF